MDMDWDQRTKRRGTLLPTPLAEGGAQLHSPLHVSRRPWRSDPPPPPRTTCICSRLELRISSHARPTYIYTYIHVLVVCIHICTRTYVMSISTVSQRYLNGISTASRPEPHPRESALPSDASHEATTAHEPTDERGGREARGRRKSQRAADSRVDAVPPAAHLG